MLPCRSGERKNRNQDSPPKEVGVFSFHRELRPMKQKRSAGCALARRRNMSQATALGTRMCQGAFFLTEINKKNGEGYQEGTAVQQGPHFSDILLFHKEKYRGTTENMKNEKIQAKSLEKCSEKPGHLASLP